MTKNPEALLKDAEDITGETLCECGHRLDDHAEDGFSWSCTIADCNCEDFEEPEAA